MKKIVLILFVVAIASSNMLAQGPPEGRGPKKSPEERAEMITKRMTKELALTPEQQTKVKAIVLKRAQERDAKIKEGKTLRDKVDTDFKLILTADQYKKYEQEKAEMKKKREQKKGQRPPAPPNGSAPPSTPPAPDQK